MAASATAHEKAQALTLVAPTPRSRAVMWMICVVAPTLLTVVSLSSVSATVGESVGLRVGGMQWGVGGSVLAVLVLTTTIWFVTDILMRRLRLRLIDGQLEVITTTFRRTLALSQLGLSDARVLDLQEQTHMRPFIKTAAMAAPGFRSGAYRLRNREKAFVAMASGPRVLWIPTTVGYGLMLEVEQPTLALQVLREAADTAAPAR